MSSATVLIDSGHGSGAFKALRPTVISRPSDFTRAGDAGSSRLMLADFAPDVTEKEVGRIERGEVQKPRPETLAKIAKRLGVEASDIGSY